MSSVYILCDADSVVAFGQGNPDVAVFPYNLASAGTFEFVEHSNNSGLYTYSKDADGEYQIEVDVDGGQVATFSTLATTIPA